MKKISLRKLLFDLNLKQIEIVRMSGHLLDKGRISKIANSKILPSQKEIAEIKKSLFLMGVSMPLIEIIQELNFVKKQLKKENP